MDKIDSIPKKVPSINWNKNLVKKPPPLPSDDSSYHSMLFLLFLKIFEDRKKEPMLYLFVFI